MSTQAAKRRKLAMHEKLLFDTIKRQAGLLEKANTEGVMNSIEAGATKVEITLVPDGDEAIMSIVDDGEGIKTIEEIEAHFETFGTPHEAHENTTWKQFRMGRGQMFAFGVNEWRTGPFLMKVDIKNWGLEWDLIDNLPFKDGCEITIDLYKNPIGYWPYYSIDSYKDAIQQQVRFVEVPIFFNGEQINTPPSQCKWDYEDDEAYYLFNAGTDMLIYNLGIFVMKIPSSRAGMAGVAVSKKQLSVNFARNDVMSDCPVYGHINEIIKKNRIKRSRKKHRFLSQCERQAILQDLRDGIQSYNDIKTLSLIPTTQGKYVSLDFVRRLKQQWSFSENGDRLADRIMEKELAVIFDIDIVYQLNYKGPLSEFFTWLTVNTGKYLYGNNEWENIAKLYTTFDFLTSGYSEEYTQLPDKKLTVSERRILKVLNSFNCWNGRVILLGSSDRASAWTDGSSYIVIDRAWLKERYLSDPLHINKLMMLLTHEMAHDINTSQTHVHGPEFYEHMVRILMSNNSPTIYNSTFYQKMRQSKIEEKREKERKRAEREQKKLEKKLGVSI